jgi:hypothetical protein
MTVKAPFPNVQCDRHPDAAPAPGYSVCRHVADAGAAIAHFEAASARALGAVLCRPCAEAPHELRLWDLRLLCAGCVAVLAGVSIVREASTAEQFAALAARAARARLVPGDRHECSDWLINGRCALCDRVVMPLVVGDVVRVGAACLANPPKSLAVIVEIYDRDARRGDRSGATLLFANGSFDGFSPIDLDVFRVVRVRHEPALADYQFQSALALHADVARGRFGIVWS